MRSTLFPHSAGWESQPPTNPETHLCLKSLGTAPLSLCRDNPCWLSSSLTRFGLRPASPSQPLLLKGTKSEQFLLGLIFPLVLPYPVAARKSQPGIQRSAELCVISSAQDPLTFSGSISKSLHVKCIQFLRALWHLRTGRFFKESELS